MGTSSDEARLAEYQALRAETLQCIETQRDLVKVNLTVSATVAALALADAAQPGLLVLLAYISPLFGLLWIDQDVKIHRMARYVRGTLWIWEPSWEQWIANEKTREKLTRVLAHTIPTVFAFVLCAIGGLVISSHHISSIGGNGVWAGALVPISVYGVVGAAYLLRGGASTAAKGTARPAKAMPQP